MIIRTIRDIFTRRDRHDLIDEPQAFERASEFMQIVMPRNVNRIKLYEGRSRFPQVRTSRKRSRGFKAATCRCRAADRSSSTRPKRWSPSTSTAGTSAADDDAEETAYQVNLRAAEEISRQIRLRDLGGVIVNDFIDMAQSAHRRGVERALREAVRRDRARTKS